MRADPNPLMAPAGRPRVTTATTVSVVTTVRDEAAHIGRLLDSLRGQGGLIEVIVVDAQSRDGTVAEARRHGADLPGFQVVCEPCGRGAGRNIGARHATGDLLAFIDGDCQASPAWTGALRRAWDGAEKQVLAGTTRYEGPRRRLAARRVPIDFEGQDPTWPSCNLAYPRSFFETLGGFDERFVTAEDIDLNLRAVAAGATIVHTPQAVVTARTRPTVGGFMRQAYWNGYGRRQLSIKHGDMWRRYRMRDTVRDQARSPWGIARLGAAYLGYMRARGDGGMT